MARPPRVRKQEEAMPTASAPNVRSRRTPGAARPRWSSTPMFVMAAAGAAIGFNNLWQFPVLTERYGGGAFLLAYCALALLLAVPLLIAQFAIGRAARQSPVRAFPELASGVSGARWWALAGAIGVAGGFLVFSYLSVIAGWALAYLVRAAFGLLSGLTADGVANIFTVFVGDPEKQLFWHATFVGLTVVVLGTGFDSLQRAIRVLVSLAGAAMLALLLYALTAGTLAAAAGAVFSIDFARLGIEGVLVAGAQVFFSIGLGTGMMLMYGAYARGGVPLGRAATSVVAVDTVVAIAAAVIVFALLYEGGVEPAAGPALLFQALPLALDHLPMGHALLTAVYLLLVAVAFLTAFALVEPAVVWIGERFRLARRHSALVCGVAAWLLGLPVVLSFNYWAYSFTFFGTDKKFGVFDAMQIATAHALLPLAGIASAIFFGWAVAPPLARAWIGSTSSARFAAWLWLLRLGIPAVIGTLLFTLPWLYA